MADTRRFDVVFQGRGTASGRMRNDIAVCFETTGERFELATDEGAFHGGENTAPPPLALFTAALTGCLMTQLRAFAPRMGIALDGLEVTARLHWEGEQEGAGPYVTHPVGFSLDIAMDTPAPARDQHALLAAARRGCFLEQTLAEGVVVGHRLRIDGTWEAA